MIKFDNDKNKKLEKLEKIYSGKAKNIFKTDDHKKLIMEFRDSITAFDGKKKAEIPQKGYYNAQISLKLFTVLNNNGIKTHFDRMFSETEMVVNTVEIIKIEFVIRNISAGSMITKYPFKIGQKFEPPILILYYKDDKYGDPMINDDIALALKLATKYELSKIRGIGQNINSILVKYLYEKNILLPDLKLEFGRSNNDIVLADEISCDTCRFWDKITGESFDKDVFRFDKGDVTTAYSKIADRILIN